MKHLHKLFFISLIIVFSLSIGLTNAQDTENLLTNGGFEGNFTIYDGEQPRQVADGWTAWHVPATEDMPTFQNRAPKYQEVAPDSSRIRTGNNAQLYFSFFETHEGGIYQQVTNVESGTEYRFSIYAHVWSSTFSDVDLSEDPGDVALRVGIDPTGGTDGASDDIIWSTPAIFYDTYRQYSVIATAESSSITVFVHSTVGRPAPSSYVYLDDAVLESTEKAEAPTTAPTTVPTSNPTQAPTQADSGIGDSTPTLEVLAPTNTALPSATPAPATPTQQTSIVPTATQVQSQNGNSGGTPTRPISDDFPGTIIHTVRRGDTVSRIALLYGSATQAIISANALNESALIYVGQGLVVPVRIADPATVTPTSTNVVIVITATQAAAPIPTPNASDGRYTVLPGDTLNKIAVQFNTTVGALVQLNGIANANRIFSGQVLTIPVATGNTGGTVAPTTAPTTAPQPNIIPTPTPLPTQQTYTVVPGDTLFSLALRFGVNIVNLASENNITNYNIIFIGQVLRIPR